MAIPTYDRFIAPILDCLAERTEGAAIREVQECAADVLGLDDGERAEILPSGTQAVYKNRAGWAHDRLKRAGLSHSPRRGVWQLTAAGVEFVRRFPGRLPAEEIAKIADTFKHVRLRQSADESSTVDAADEAIAVDSVRSPEERLDQALAEIRDSVARELLENIAAATPRFFEALVLDLLHAMGYGASRADLQQVGGSGDGGIDGVISLDRLGLEKVYVQAKRWQSAVGRPDVQAFYGALAGQRASKGVFITTSNYSEQAKEFAASVGQIVLVDGALLGSLMIEHGVGVSQRTFAVPRVDSDYFEV